MEPGREEDRSINLKYTQMEEVRQHTYNTKKYEYRKRQIQIQMKYTQLKEVRESTH